MSKPKVLMEKLPLALYAVDQPLVNKLCALVNFLGKTTEFPVDKVPGTMDLQALYASIMEAFIEED